MACRLEAGAVVEDPGTKRRGDLEEGRRADDGKGEEHECEEREGNVDPASDEERLWVFQKCLIPQLDAVCEQRRKTIPTQALDESEGVPVAAPEGQQEG